MIWRTGVSCAIFIFHASIRLEQKQKVYHRFLFAIAFIALSACRMCSSFEHV
jgi:hypothetical protein